MPRLSPWSFLVALVAAAGLATPQGSPEEKGRMFVLVVGVEDYADPKITDLRFSEDDAQAVYDFFAEDPRSPTTKDRVKLLLGKQATRIDVLCAIDEHLVRRAVGPRDTAILYFAGHGFSDTQGVYLATSDTRLGKLRYSAISWAELQRLWSQIGAGRRILLADACHSGGIEGLRGPGGIAKRALAVKIAKPDFASAVIAATGANEFSMEDEASKHGVFTAALLSGLRGHADKDRDGNVSLGELTGYLTTQVPREARKAGGAQTPTIRFNGSESFARRLQLSRGKLQEVGSGDSQLARVQAKRKAAERERERAELRSQVAEAKLKRLQGASAEELRRAQAEAAQAKADLAKAQAATKRVREEELKRIGAEKRAAKAEAENAELRKQLAELKGDKAQAEAAAKQAEAARRRERALRGSATSSSAPPALNPSEKDPRVRPSLMPPECPSCGGFGIEQPCEPCDEKGMLPGTKLCPACDGYGTVRGPCPNCAPTARAISLAKRDRDFSYLDSRTYSCGGKRNKIARFKHLKTGLIFHLIPGGTYKRGSESGSAWEKPVRIVTIQPFLICATECTQAAWAKVMSTGVAKQRDLANPNWPLRGTSDDRPMYYVSWLDSQDFCRKSGLRLPSEAEWEFACRAGTTTKYGYGDNASRLGAHAEFGDNNGQETKPVGGKKPNAFGLYDMHGNVWEWCQDAYAASLSTAPTDGSAHQVAGAFKRVSRGGGWDDSASNCRSAYRGWFGTGTRSGNLGFRPAWSLP